MTEFLRQIGWLGDLLDIAVVTLVIYRLLLPLKGTMAVRTIVSLAVLFCGYFVSQFLGLRTLNWLFDNAVGSLAVILIVVFQSDIRRALLAAGRNRTGVEQPKYESHELIDELATACEVMADKSIGALMVIERDMGVEPFLAVGTEIDAKVTSELITSIFLPYSPIHDGAVIIRKGKLTRAGCFLPLTQNPEISKSLGTRHRAAIGLTEVTDALVIVVSEETGGISFVADGKITRDLSSGSLRKTLRRFLESRWLE